MKNYLLWAILFSILPGFETRIGIPILYNNIQNLGVVFWIYFSHLVFFNGLVVFPMMFFLEFAHDHLLNWKLYKKTFGRFVESKKKTADKVQDKMHNMGYIALALFVAIPFTGTGAYTGSVVAWTLGLSKRKTFFSILLGVALASIITLVLTFLFFSAIA